MESTSEGKAVRHHWVNTLTGVLDQAMHLDDAEQLFCAATFKRMLDFLRIPSRGRPSKLPSEVALEVHHGHYTALLEAPRHSKVRTAARRVTEGDLIVGLEVWRDALAGLIENAYPDLSGEERIFMRRVLTDLLMALGIPERASTAYPDSVIVAYRAAVDRWRR